MEDRPKIFVMPPSKKKLSDNPRNVRRRLGRILTEIAPDSDAGRDELLNRITSLDKEDV